MASTARHFGISRRSWANSLMRYNSQVSTNAKAVSSEGKNSFYPPIKPKYPPGRWGGMEPSYAWLWHKQEEESLAIPDVQKRTAALCNKEKKQLVMKVRDIRPGTLEFKKYITKTHVLSGLPDIYSSSLDSALLDKMTSRLSSLVCDLIVFETDQMLRRGFLKKFKMAGDQHQCEMAHGLFRSIINHLAAQLAAHFPHLLTMQFDEKVTLSAFWDRHGISRTRTRMIHPDYFEFQTVGDTCITSTTTADFLLRAEKPLPEFVSRDAASSMREIPKLKYSPLVYGQKYQVKEKRHLEAGHVWGDPCEFGSLAVLNTVWSRRVADKFGQNHALEAQLGHGIGTSFVWLAAQAYNQGFNTLIDVTYPLTTQMILTDGQTWQFMTYQLNTLQLWKDEEANDLINLCWVDPQTKLFEHVEGSKVYGFNTEVLKQLIACLALAPRDRPYNLRPTLPSSAVNPRDREVLIPLKKEEVTVTEEEKYIIE
ncbi:large ribosomal subunit protein mL65-like [Babylonia areolata]|uniref:large ribosomal subunit protein mL65-like n=1 Tax=Babylonia areolata TaxID=304850 RepID=UPI003FD1A017